MDGFGVFIIVPIVLLLSGISIFFYIAVLFIPVFFLSPLLVRAFLEFRFKYFGIVFDQEQEKDFDNIYLGIVLGVANGIFLYEAFGFKWNSFSDFIFNLLDNIF
tara:strand:+ start:538 stop:849 length:312 start_codon:yes stop_codon:yes gene_type:complete